MCVFCIMMLNVNLEKAYEKLELNTILTDFFNKYYVSRGFEKKIDDWAKNFEEGTHKVLYAGHIGSGKTTELRYIQRYLIKKGFLVPFIFISDTFISKKSLNYNDFLLLLLKKMYEVSADNNLSVEPEIEKEIVYLLNEIFIHDEKSKTLKKELDIEKLFKLQTKILSIDDTRKDKIAKKMKKSSKNIIKILNDIVKKIETETQKKLVIIVDDLEKISDEKTLPIFLREHNKDFTSLNCNVISTIAPSIFYDTQLTQNLSVFDMMYFLPLFEVIKKNGKINNLEVSKFIEVVRKRKISDKTISDEIIKQCAIKSGGHITEFLRILQSCIVKTHIAKKKTVSKNVLEQVLKDTERYYQKIIPKKSYPTLLNISRTKKIKNTKDSWDLLMNQFVFEYGTGDKRWWDLNPIIKNIVQK